MDDRRQIAERGLFKLGAVKIIEVPVGKRNEYLVWLLPAEGGCGDWATLVVSLNAKRDPVMMEDRDFSRVPLNASLGPSGSGNIPGGRVGLSGAQMASLNLGMGAGVIPVGPEGCTTQVNSIRFGANGQVLRHCDPETLYNYAAGNYLLILKRK